MELKKRIFTGAVAGYLFLPILIFFVGWTRWYFALLLLAGVGFSVFTMVKKEQSFSFPEKYSDKTMFLVVLGLIILWAYFSGVGGFVWQNDDHAWRNRIFELLVTEKWPVIMDATDINSGKEMTSVMTYYLGFWLPSAVVGKLFGLKAGFAFQLVWLILGLLLVFELISIHLKKYSLKYLILFILFSGLDVAGLFFTQGNLQWAPFPGHIEWWSGYQYSSNTTLVFWVFNQAIYAWIILLFLLLQTDNRHIVFIYSCGLLFCTIPFVGIMPFFIYQVLKNMKIKESGFDLKRIFFDLFTVENVVAGGLVGILSFLYLRNNSSAQKMNLSAPIQSRAELYLYIVFILFDVGFYLFAIVGESYKKPLFWIMTAVLVLTPMVRVGYGKDFCMRASIPALLMLYLFVIRSLESYKNKKKWNRYAFLVLLLSIGAATPVREFVRTGVNTNTLAWQGDVSMNYVDDNEIMGAPNFSADIKDNYFYNYISK